MRATHPLPSPIPAGFYEWAIDVNGDPPRGPARVYISRRPPLSRVLNGETPAPATGTATGTGNRHRQATPGTGTGNRHQTRQQQELPRPGGGRETPQSRRDPPGAGAMLAPQRPLRSAALLLSISLLAQSRPQTSPRPPAEADRERERGLGPAGPSPFPPPPPGEPALEPAHNGLTKRAAPAAHNEVLKDLEELGRLRAEAKRDRERDRERGRGWPSSRQLRQQQSLEHQLLERRYEELAESRRQAEAARKAAAEEERLADLASDLLLRYLLRGPAAAVAEDKRSEEAEPDDVSLESNDIPLDGGEEGPEGSDGEAEGADGTSEADDAEDLDPGTIDQLIELSSKLHLPADDVVDIIHDVEQKRKKDAAPGPSPRRFKPPPPPPPRSRPRARPGSDWNAVLPAPARPGPAPVVSNHISARTFLPPPRRPPPPLEDEELQNYLERVLSVPSRGYP
ncbi:neurosecretory protein VGF [Struthio camelus]|uniref:neurosecretory protein VGF n=1 Tax=Struthio camelus TaxID=8801 RepID=UPI003603CC38